MDYSGRHPDYSGRETLADAHLSSLTSEVTELRRQRDGWRRDALNARRQRDSAMQDVQTLGVRLRDIMDVCDKAAAEGEASPEIWRIWRIAQGQ